MSNRAYQKAKKEAMKRHSLCMASLDYILFIDMKLRREFIKHNKRCDKSHLMPTVSETMKKVRECRL